MSERLVQTSSGASRVPSTCVRACRAQGRVIPAEPTGRVVREGTPGRPFSPGHGGASAGAEAG